MRCNPADISFPFVSPLLALPANLRIRFESHLAGLGEKVQNECGAVALPHTQFHGAPGPYSGTLSGPRYIH